LDGNLYPSRKGTIILPNIPTILIFDNESRISYKSLELNKYEIFGGDRDVNCVYTDLRVFVFLGLAIL